MTEPHHLYIGIAAFLVVLVSVVLWTRALSRVAIPGNRSAFVASWLLGLALGITALLLGGPASPSSAPAWFATLVAGLLLFTVSISKQKLGDSAIRVGDRIPAFTARDEFDETFDSSSLIGQLILIKFFRGHW